MKKTDEVKVESKKEKFLTEELGSQIENLTKATARSVKKAFNSVLKFKKTVFSSGMEEDTLNKLNMLVDAGIFKNKSESTVFLINEGVKVQKELFESVSKKLKEIEKAQDDLKNFFSDREKKKSVSIAVKP